MVDKILKFLLLASPIAYMGGMSLNAFNIRFFYIGAMLLFMAALYEKPVREMPGKKILITFLGICLFNVFIHRLKLIIIDSVFDIFLAIIILYIIVRYCKKPRECYKYIVWAGVINLIVVGFQYMGFSPVLSSNHQFISESGGLIGNSARLTNYLALILPFMLNASIWLFLLCIAVSIVSTEYSLLMIGIIILFFKSINSKLSYKIAIISIALTSIGIFHNEIMRSFIIRINIWKDVLNGFFIQPLAGYGLGVFPYGMDKMLPGKDAVIFSSLLQFIIGAGVLGVAWLGYVIRVFIKKFDWSLPSSGMVSLFCLSTIEYPIEIPRLWFTIIAIIGFFIINITERSVIK